MSEKLSNTTLPPRNSERVPNSAELKKVLSSSDAGRLLSAMLESKTSEIFTLGEKTYHLRKVPSF